MKYYHLVLLLALFGAGHAYAQTTPAPLDERLADYLRLARTGQVDSLLDMTDPELFAVVPREQLRAGLAGTTADGDLSVRIAEFAVDDVAAPVGYRRDTFVTVAAHVWLVFELRAPAYRTPGVRDRVRRMLEKTYGPARVRQTGEFELRALVDKSLLAIRRGAGRPWFFVEYGTADAAVLDLLVPPAVRERVGR